MTKNKLDTTFFPLSLTDFIGDFYLGRYIMFSLQFLLLLLNFQGEARYPLVNSFPSVATNCLKKKKKKKKTKGTLYVLYPSISKVALSTDVRLLTGLKLIYKVDTVQLSFWSRCRSIIAFECE